MKILSIRSAPPGSGNTVARFDVQMDGMRLYNIALKQTGSGLRVFAPSAFGSAVATFTAETATAIIQAAMGEIARETKSAP